MKKIYYSALFLLFTSCIFEAEPSIEEIESLNMRKYQGFQIVSLIESSNRYKSDVVIKNDSMIIRIFTPKFFGKIYKVGDTIR